MNKMKLFTIAAISFALLPFNSYAQEKAPITVAGIASLPSTPSSYSLWQEGYDKELWQVVVGYVNKSWICTYDSGTQREDFFGDANDKFLHGIQFGALFTPSFEWGLGLRTGLFFEGYTSRSRWITEFCHHFSEADLYIPVHASYRIPFSDNIGLNILGGIGFQWAMSGSYYKQVGTSWKWGWWRRPIPVYVDKKHQYGFGFPEKVNWQAECGFNLRVKSFGIGFIYSFGIRDHGIQNTFDDGQTYVTAKKSRQDKMQASVSFIF